MGLLAQQLSIKHFIYVYAHDCQQFLEVGQRFHLPFVAIRSHAYLYAMLDGEVFN
jgi:hypothetical protein